MKRKKIIAANWKMYKTVQEAPGFHARPSCRWSPDHDRDEIVICPPFVDIACRRGAGPRHSTSKVGAQNMYWEKEGAFTGEVSRRAC